MAILVFVNGTVVSNINYNEEIQEIIAVDGGFDKIPQSLRSASHIKIFGDLDSIQSTTNNYEVFKYPKEKDYSDFELALNYISKTYKNERVEIYGLLGGRIDHQLFNLFILKKYIKNNFFTAHSENETIFFSDSDLKIKGYQGKVFSVFPLTKLQGLSLEGAYYPLNKRDVEQNTSLTLSNEIIQNELRVSVEKGIYAVIVNI